MTFSFVLCVSVFVDQVLGDPKFLYHPVALIGKLINFLKSEIFSDYDSFYEGLVVCVITLIATGLSVYLILYISNFNSIVQIYLIYSALAWRDLKDETEIIFECLVKDDILNARKFLSHVVGRDTENLNKTEITRAAIETISENSIDGIISVIFFAALGYFFAGNSGMCVSVWIFKASSTLDSMIGYESYGNFGKSSAKLDDILNFIPARIGGLIIIISGGMKINSLKIFLNDRKKHKSPNSAHGESAFSGVLNVRLGGGGYYDGKFESRPYINSQAQDPEIYDILRALKLLDVSCSLTVILAVLLI